MYRLVGLCGSLRAASSNLGLLRMAQRLAPPALAFEVYEGAADLPFYNPDFDTEDRVPDEALAWRRLVTEADGLFVAAPEYNLGPSAVFKNAIDWATRPFNIRPLQGKVVSIVTSGGGGGGRRFQQAMTAILEALGNTVVAEPEIALVHGSRVVAPDGTATDPEVEAAVAARLSAIVDALRARPVAFG